MLVENPFLQFHEMVLIPQNNWHRLWNVPDRQFDLLPLHLQLHQSLF